MTHAGVFVNAVLVLDSNSGARIHAKYFAQEFAGAPEKQVSGLNDIPFPLLAGAHWKVYLFPVGYSSKPDIRVAPIVQNEHVTDTPFSLLLPAGV